MLRGGAALGLGVAGSALLAACGDDGDGSSTGSAGTSASASLLAAFPQSNHVPAGVPFRLPYLLTDAEGVPSSEIDGPVTFTVRRDGEVVGEPVRVEPHDDGVPRAYLPFTFTFPSAGIYEVGAEVDGERLTSALQVHDRSEIRAPLPGDPLPAVHTPTVVDAAGVSPICTNAEQCPLHEVDLGDAIGQGRPIVLLVATPAYCQTAVCGPTLDLLVETLQGRDDLVVVHAEVYANPTEVDEISQADLAPLPKAYNLDLEPVLFVTDASGTITARADVTVDRAEMAELIPAAG